MRTLVRWAARLVLRFAWLPPILLFGFFVGYTALGNPRFPCRPILVDVGLPSEKAIPPDVAVGPSQPAIVRTFRYAPTGTELGSGVPYWIFRVLPRLFPDEFGGLPPERAWERFGLFTGGDPATLRPSGLPRGMVAADSEVQLPGLRFGLRLKRVAFNCAGCHQSEYLDDAGQRVLVDGMPNHVADTQGYKRMVRRVARRPEFTFDNVVAAIDAELAQLGRPPLDTTERLVYRYIVGRFQEAGRDPADAWMESRPPNGPGRIDAFGAVKYGTLGAADDHDNSTVDLPSLWNQDASFRPWHHWDGNTADSRARNYGSVVGVGGTAMSVRGGNVDRVAAWIERELPPPRFPFRRATSRVADGEQVYRARCAACHGVYHRDGNRLETVAGSQLMQILEVGTDPRRREAFGPATAQLLDRWGFERGIWARDAFRPAGAGYLAAPLDGIWARAPYLHNGSVPTLRDLLEPPEHRPQVFYRGYDVFDQDKVGFVSHVPDEHGRTFFQFDTRLPGNGNGGHLYGTDLSAEQKKALVEYMKQL